MLMFTTTLGSILISVCISSFTEGDLYSKIENNIS